MSAPRPCRTCGRPFSAWGKERYCSKECRCGSDAGYNAGCKCDRCLRAHSQNHKKLRYIPNPDVDATGTHRRVQALACLGWSTAELSRRLGKHRSYVLKVMQNGRLEAATALTFRRLYDELSMTWCTSTTAGRTAADARRRGWAPPLAWDERSIDNPDAKPRHNARGTSDLAAWQHDVDMAVVWRLVDDGHRVRRLTRAEGREAYRILVGRGLSTFEIEERYGLNSDRYADEVA